MVPEPRVARARCRPPVMAPARQRAARAHSARSPAPAQEQRREAASGCQQQAAVEERAWRAQEQVEPPPQGGRWQAPEQVEPPPQGGRWQAPERPRLRAPSAEDLRAPSALASGGCLPGWAIPPARTAPGSRRRAAESHRRRAACHPGSVPARCRPRRAARRGSGRNPRLWPSTQDATDETGACPGPLSRPYIQYDACWSCRCPIDDRSSEAARHIAIGTRHNANAPEHSQNDERRKPTRMPHGTLSA